MTERRLWSAAALMLALETTVLAVAAAVERFPGRPDRGARHGHGRMPDGPAQAGVIAAIAAPPWSAPTRDVHADACDVLRSRQHVLDA
jgi:hypothetical protein